MTILIERAVCVPSKAIGLSKDKKAAVKKKIKKRNFSFDFATETYLVKKYYDKNNHRLKVLAYFVDLVQQAKNGKYKNPVLLFTDNIEFVVPPHALHDPPSDWNMVILYGSMSEPKHINNSSTYSVSRMNDVMSFLVHPRFFSSFIVKGKKVLAEYNSSNSKDPVNTLFDLLYTDSEISSSIYVPKFGVTNNSNITSTPKSFQTIKTKEETVELEDGTTGVAISVDTPNLSEESLPFVSLVTPTYCNTYMFFLTVMCFLKQKYPEDKIEWIIVDDSPSGPGYKDLTKILPPEESRIRYLKCNSSSRLSLGKKLNLGATQAKGEYIVHFFDSVYYPPESVMFRVANLVNADKISIIGSTEVGCYNIMDHQSFIHKEVDQFGNPTVLQESSMAYTKEFWSVRPFNEGVINDNQRNTVSILWLEGVYHLVLTVPYQMVATKITKTLGVGTNKGIPSKFNFMDTWDEDTRKTMELVKNDVIKSIGKLKNNK